jgi:hippurate hydrolase
VNSLPEAELARRAAVAAFGEASVKTLELPSMGAEDFSFMLREKPGCYIWLGNGPGEGGCTLHNPAYDFNDEAIAFGISYWASLVATALSNSSRLSGDR